MARPATGNVKVNLYFDEKILKALRHIGAARGITYSELVREAVRRYVLAEGGKVVLEAAEMKRLVPQ